MAIIANALLEKSEYGKVVSVSANYPGRSIPGAAEIQTGAIAGSRQFDHLQARLLQGGREKILASGIIAANLSRGDSRRYEKSPVKVPPVSGCIPVPALPNYTIFEHVEVFLDPACCGWMQNGNLAERSEMNGWIQFKQQRPMDATAVLLMADAFPPSILASQGMVAWVPTLQMSVTVRNLPASQRLRCRFYTNYITAGILEEDGEIWDEAGALIATSRQIAQFRR